MKKVILTLVSVVFIANMSFSQKESNKEDIKFRHSIGSSLFMLYNFTEESADYVLLTYGYKLTNKDRIFAEYNTWKYSEPMGAYGKTEEFYPGFVRCHGIGFGYQRFFWKGLYSTAQATPFIKQYYDENDNKTQKGFQLYLQLALGYRFELFNNRLYIEPAAALKYWPIDTNVPDDFAAIEEGTPKTILEPSLNIGINF